MISDTAGWREFTETVDVSEAGLKLQLTHPMPPLTTLRVSLEMAKWPEEVARIWASNAISGLVRYCTKRSGLTNLVGLQLCPAPEPPCRAEAFADESGDS